ncbi:MAG TPA: two-component regulator propeller domain-containing protein [Pyrinomonadaceae bacterium]|nr:two-component regulator propeller domain-containing protein [Pyrinomonadaceae bacterium]
MRRSKMKSRFLIGNFLLCLIFSALLLNFSQTKPKSENLAPPEEDAETMLTLLLSDKTRNLHQWSAISQFHGLPSEHVNAIEQTPDGIMWFATDSGLAKFDGRRVQSVSPENFSNRRIPALKTDQSGALWIGTEKGAFRFYNNSFLPIPQTADFSINSIAVSAENKIFLSTENNPNSKNTFIEIVQNSEGGLVTNIIYEKPSELKSPAVPPKEFNENVGVVNSTAFDTDENLWVGTKGNGVFLFRGAEQIAHYTLENTAGGLRSNEVLSIFVDRENVIWFGTTKGISRFDPNSPLSEQFAVGTDSNFIRTIFQAKDGKIYAGTQQGLFVSESVGNWKIVDGFEKRRIYSIAENEKGNLLLGTSRGLFFYPPISNETVKPTTAKTAENASNETEKQPPTGSIRAIQSYQNKIFLGVFGQGLARLENANFIPLSNNPPETLNVTSLKSAAGRLWLGTAENGAFYFDGNKFASDKNLENLKNKAIWAIEGSVENGLWFGTEKGLFLYKNGELTTISTELDVRGVALSADGNGIWCATEKNGLVRFAEDKNFGWVSSRLDVEQGLPSQKIFSVFRQTDDTFLIGTTRGVVRYKTPKTKPLLVPTRILSRRLHAPEELQSQIVLEYPQNTLTAEVSAINSRTFPEQFQYAFLLFDSKNTVVRKKFSNDAQFLMDNLVAGNYTVEIRAFDKNLISSEPLTFQFKVEKPPFPWITLALTVLLLLALIALIWAILSQRKIYQKSSQLKQANRELNMARLDLANEAERERRRISRDLHDQTLADLRHLQLLTDKLPASEETAESSKTIRHEIENVSKEIRRICEDLSPSVLENIGFSAALEWALSNSLQTNPEKQKIEYEFVCSETIEENLPLSPSEQIQIYRIAQEVLSNISRHSDASKVKMTVEKTVENEFLLRIEDNGKGFDFEKTLKREGRGISNIKSRANLIEAEFSFAKSVSGGTIFTLVKN